ALSEPARLDDGLIAASGAHRARLGQLRASAGAAAEHVDEGILEPWRRRPHLGALAGPTPGLSDGPVLRLGVPRDDEAKRLALDDAVDDAAPAEHLGEHRAPALPDAGQPEDAAVHLPGEIRRRPGKEQFARVEQEDPVTGLRLVEIGGRPQDADALAGEFLDHGPQVAPGDRIDADARFV